MFIHRLIAEVRGIDPHTTHRLQEMPISALRKPELAAEAISGTYACDVSAPESTPAAIGAFLASASFDEAICLAVSLGGDTDTIAAMAGGIAGAYHGYDALPECWLNCLENLTKGRDYVLRLCADISAQIC